MARGPSAEQGSISGTGVHLVDQESISGPGVHQRAMDPLAGGIDRKVMNTCDIRRPRLNETPLRHHLKQTRLKKEETIFLEAHVSCDCDIYIEPFNWKIYRINLSNIYFVTLSNSQNLKRKSESICQWINQCAQ